LVRQPQRDLPSRSYVTRRPDLICNCHSTVTIGPPLVKSCIVMQLTLETGRSGSVRRGLRASTDRPHRMSSRRLLSYKQRRSYGLVNCSWNGANIVPRYMTIRKSNEGGEDEAASNDERSCACCCYRSEMQPEASLWSLQLGTLTVLSSANKEVWNQQDT
jgi:hypothetical protein